MKHHLRRAALLAITALLACLSCGCGLILSPEALYSLPKLPSEYTELGICIDQVLAGGAEYAAPISGTNIQPVQLVDLDGDGQKEAVAFFRNTAEERPLKIYVFTPQEQGYVQTAVIEGSGTAINSITYDDMNGDGLMELVVGWRVSTEVQALTVYALPQGEPVELTRTNYVKYAIADMDQDGLRELVVFRSDDAGYGVADYYRWQSGGLTSQSSVRISSTVAELSGQQGRVVTGAIQEEVPALFVTGVEDSTSTVTDILAVRGGELTNIVLSSTTGVSTEIASYCSLYPSDINGDGLTEVPKPTALPTGGNMEGALCQRVDWYSYDSSGEATAVLSTYHDTESGWYIRLPESWEDRILATRVSGIDETVVTFSIRGSSTEVSQDFLRITTLTGSSRESRAARSGRIILSRRRETIYTAELLEANGTWAYGLTEDEVRSAFSLISTDWVADNN